MSVVKYACQRISNCKFKNILGPFLTLNIFEKPKKAISILNEMEYLRKESVCMKNPDHVEKILCKLSEGGASKLQVISDFDHTLSRVHKGGVQCTTTYGILEEGPFINKDYKFQANSLFNYYHPIEIDPNLTKEEKTPYMIEWYAKSLNLMSTSGVSKDKIPEMVKVSNVCLREGCDVMFKSLNKHGVPVLIFSAGIGDILKEVLRQQNLMLPNMKIIANFIHYDEKDNIAGFQGNFIHTFNKNQSSIANSDYFNTLKFRSNVILLGDSLGDLDMSEGVENIETILRIGFLNYKIEENLPDYLEGYDIVLRDDQTMDVVNRLLKKIL